MELHKVPVCSVRIAVCETGYDTKVLCRFHFNMELSKGMVHQQVEA